MARKHLFDTVRYTSVGLFRMGRDGVRTLLDKAYVAGKSPKTEQPMPAVQSTETTPSDADVHTV